jgi:hypothetical protein
MTDYEPIDLSKWANSPVGIVPGGDDNPIVTGQQSMRGLPFLIGRADGGACKLLAPAFENDVTIPIGSTARRVIFAHRLLQSNVPEGGPLGVTVAEYVFRLTNGQEIRANIRERFEISTAGASWEPWLPGMAYLAVPAETPGLHPRYEGSWDEAGRRQTDVGFENGVKSFYLWAWVNPQPDVEIESLTIVSAGPSFVVGGVTLGHVDEHPFARQGAKPVRIALTEPENAEKPFCLDVKVDRGEATYIYPLPESTTEEFLADSPGGWGEELNTKSSLSYVEISAIPSATVSVMQDDKELASVKWGEVEEKGVVETPRVHVQLIDPGKNWVKVTVVDDDTGMPVPCRVHFRSPEGVPYQPHGHHNHVNGNRESWHVDVGGDLRLGQITYAYIDGTCEGWLPRGDVIVDVARGFEYEPIRTKVRIEPGQQRLELRLKRWINMNEQGWYSGDTHVHFLSERGSHTESSGEDLNVVNLLQAQWGSLFTNTEEFTGEPSVSRVGDNIVYVSQENRQHFLGHLTLLGLKRPVMPWSSDGQGEGELGGTMETTLSHWADEAHSQGGYVVGTHFPQPNNGEPAAMVATGRLDAIEMISMARANHNEYYRYLNCGYRLPIVGGTDKMSSDVPVGLYRTYAKLGTDEEFNYDAWCRSVVAGRTMLSGGPIVHLKVDGMGVGDTLRMSGPGTVEVEAWAESIFPINTLQIVQEGRVVASSESANGTRRLSLKGKIRVDGHSWLAARCGGPDYFGSNHLDVWERGIFAHTSPVYVACGQDWWMFNEETARYMLTMIEGNLGYIREQSHQHPHGSVSHHHGEPDHMAFLQRPLNEARDAVKKRLDR